MSIAAALFPRLGGGSSASLSCGIKDLEAAGFKVELHFETACVPNSFADKEDRASRYRANIPTRCTSSILNQSDGKLGGIVIQGVSQSAVGQLPAALGWIGTAAATAALPGGLMKTARGGDGAESALFVREGSNRPVLWVRPGPAALD